MAAPEPTIRPARPDDVAAVRALLVETWHHTYDALLGPQRVTEITDTWHAAENLARQLGAPGTSFLVAEAGGRIVGHVFADARKPPSLVVSRLYVLPSHQRRGIGGELLAAVIARHPGARALHLAVEAENAKALAFYRRQGFAVRGERTDDGIPHVQLERRLAPGSG